MSEKRIESIVDPIAIDEGRVFIGKKRAKRGDVVQDDSEVRVHEQRNIDAPVVFLHRAKDLVAVDKPAGIATVPDTRDAHNSLVHRVAREIGVRAESIHVTSRLDRDVSGVVVFALTAAARNSLQNARTSSLYFRRYVAIAASAPSPNEGEWDAPIDGKPSRSRYRVAAATPRGALLHVEPVTGRTHQIRIHASGAKAPLLGDTKYGGSRTLVMPTGKVLPLERIALHCAHVRVEGIVDARAPMPAELRAWWAALGGAPDALD
ncbi:MAG TPA: RluA family pseudouridine synthase [Polyangiaceae bacterium]|jgi:23S rRNA-/tRNA-specific pseudouridylate synthase|nr:RluA family pseudouridine synthase [Polyangiaceae bacterium]